MIGKILHALGIVGMTTVMAIFTFALWVFAKGEQVANQTRIPSHKVIRNRNGTFRVNQ